MKWNNGLLGIPDEELENTCKTKEVLDLHKCKHLRVPASLVRHLSSLDLFRSRHGGQPPLQHQAHMIYMFLLGLGKNEYVIKIHKHIHSQNAIENDFHQRLERA